jgi:hypothetical protein
MSSGLPNHRPSILVVEPELNWLPQFQRQFPSHDVRAVEFEALNQDATAALTVIVLREPVSGAGAFLEWVASGRMRRLPTVVLASRADRPLEWLLRDLGATAVLAADAPRDEVFRVCRRLLDRLDGIPAE